MDALTPSDGISYVASHASDLRDDPSDAWDPLSYVLDYRGIFSHEASDLIDP
jgi:hypothetical protein